MQRKVLVRLVARKRRGGWSRVWAGGAQVGERVGERVERNRVEWKRRKKEVSGNSEPFYCATAYLGLNR